MRFLKNVLSMMIVFMLILSVPNFFTASADSSPITATKDNADQILLDYGLDQTYIDNVSVEDKIDLASTILINPELVEVATTVDEFYELDMIEEFVNTDDKTLEAKYDKKIVKEVQSSIDELNDLKDADIKRLYHKSDEEIKMLRFALKKNKNYVKPKFSENVVTSSGNIAASKLTTSLTKTDNRSATCKAVSYKIIYTFNWKSQPLCHLNDDVVVTWGGDLNSRSLVRKLTSVDGYTSTATGSNYMYYNGIFGATKTVIGTATQTLNKGIFCQHSMDALPQDDSHAHYIKSGSYSLTIYQNTKKNFSTQVLARYAHKVPSIYWSSMSFSKSGVSVGISLGFGYDYSQESNVYITA